VQRTSDLRIRSISPLISPQALVDRHPLSEKAAAAVVECREAIRRILRHEDPRLLAVVGPCSIHDYQAALDYARRLRALKQRYASRLHILMRVYFEKPRTTVGWRGLIIDPNLNGTYDINAGLELARRLLLEIAGLGLGAGTEMLDPIVPQYIADLIGWAAIGARTTESQTHRNMVTRPVHAGGFKNSTTATCRSPSRPWPRPRQPHHFIRHQPEGQTSVLETAGNEDTHIILRGSRTGANYRKRT